MIAERLRNLAWEQDRLIVNDTVFRLEHSRDDSWDLGERCFTLYKTRYLMDQYAAFFAARPEFRPLRVLELGMWDWGSGAFWLECLEPEKYVGIDWFRKDRTEYLEQYLTRRGCAERFRAYWETDQSDAQALRRIVEKEFGGQVDLIIDDASHMYELTRRSFESLLPHLRPGGYYIIEDWAWSHWPTFEPPPNPWLTASGVTPLITELVEMIGTSNLVLSDAAIYTGFAAFQRTRGGARPGVGKFALEHWISRRQPAELPGSQPVAAETAAANVTDPPPSAPSAEVARLARLLRPISTLVPESFWALIDLIHNPIR